MILTLALVAALQAGQAGTDSLRAELLAAEDARARTEAQLAVLVGALGHPDTLIQRMAVRALGRLERPELLGRIAGVLSGAAASVRLEAANAAAQAAYRVDGGPALAVLRSRVAAESSPVVLGGVLAAVGRLRLAPGSAGSREVELILTDALVGDGAHLGGALRGTWDFLRRQGRSPAASPAMVASLRRRVLDAPAGPPRRAALQALLLVGAADSSVLAAALRAPDEQLRRVAAAGTRTAPQLGGRLGLIRSALDDPSVMVRLEAVRAWATHGRTAEGCAPLVAATRDPAVPVQLLAIEALGAGCGPVGAPVDLLRAIAAEPAGPATWHRPVRALVALATADTAVARLRIGAFVGSPIWWVRMHAAAAAQRLGDRALLLQLLDDPVDNVREAALRGLVAVAGRAADRAALAQLGRADYQLLVTAAGALRGATDGPSVVAAAFEALDRTSRDRRETSRDPRLALLDRIEEFGTAAEGPRLARYLEDFDPAIADRAAAIITRLTGSPVRAEPRPQPPLPVPSPAELRRMTTAVITLQDGGRLVLRLRPGEAPANVARFVAMARAGWFDGLTLHRVVPNFVLQGGSPAANEYAGGAEFSRDEVGGSHWRGTVGISTRGRDTGDGQLFLNLVDNLNLDHEYTVIAEVTTGIELLDRILEGAVIARVEVGNPAG